MQSQKTIGREVKKECEGNGSNRPSLNLHPHYRSCLCKITRAILLCHAINTSHAVLMIKYINAKGKTYAYILYACSHIHAGSWKWETIKNGRLDLCLNCKPFLQILSCSIQCNNSNENGFMNDLFKNLLCLCFMRKAKRLLKFLL